MAHDGEPLAILKRSLDQLESMVGRTGPDQAALPTPCRSWTVADLVGHLLTDLDNFATSVRGGEPKWGAPPRPLEGDWGTALAAGRRDLDEAWAAADLQAEVPSMFGGTAPLVDKVDQQVVEFAVHAWDLARATGYDGALDDGVAEFGMTWATASLSEQFRGPEDEGKSFGPEVPVPADAPVYERLAGWFGRDPNWSA